MTEIIKAILAAIWLMVIGWKLIASEDLKERLSHGECPLGWYVNGVRPNGVFACLPVLGDPDRDIRDARDCIDIDDDRQITGAIYCTGGAHPVVNGPRTVGCQR